MKYEWQPISTAPKEEGVLLFGEPYGHIGEVKFNGPIITSGYWDSIDSAWCATTADWTGPFIEATHWMPLPPKPEV
jgi:hypothetical protein